MDHAKYASKRLLTRSKLDKEIEDMLYQKFKETNWWARNTYVPFLLVGLCGVAFLWWAMNADLNQIALSGQQDLVQALPLLVFAGAAILMMLLAIPKYFFHDRPWKKYSDERSLADNDRWSSNCGNMLKIYD